MKKLLGMLFKKGVNGGSNEVCLKSYPNTEYKVKDLEEKDIMRIIYDWEIFSNNKDFEDKEDAMFFLKEYLRNNDKVTNVSIKELNNATRNKSVKAHICGKYGFSDYGTLIKANLFKRVI